MTAGALDRSILWNKEPLHSSIQFYNDPATPAIYSGAHRVAIDYAVAIAAVVAGMGAHVGVVG
eukprot:COSAG06_NODE_14342_length_1165_cov_1.002814_1_plen_62_part_10